MSERSEEFRLRRRTWALRGCLPLLDLIAAWHRLEVEGAAHLPTRGAALLVVKHRATRDSLLLSQLLYRTTGRMANYWMKYRAAGLPPQLLERFGGIPVIRPQDILRLKTPAQRRAQLRKARAMCDEARAYVTWLYRRGELVVVYPEGTFYPDRIGPLYTGALRQVHRLTRTRGLTIPIVPIGTAYERRGGLRPPARFQIGPPLDATAFPTCASLVNRIREQLQTLSGLSTADSAGATSVPAPRNRK